MEDPRTNFFVIFPNRLPGGSLGPDVTRGMTKLLAGEVSLYTKKHSNENREAGSADRSFWT